MVEDVLQLTEKERQEALKLWLEKKKEEAMEKRMAEAVKSMEPKKKGLQLPAKVRLTKYGSVELRVYLPQNYVRKVIRVETLPKEQLPKAKK